MKWLCLIAAVLGIGVGILVWPLVNEGAGSTCEALEDLAARQFSDNAKSDPTATRSTILWGTAIVHGIAALSRGKIAATAVKEAYPNLPPFVGCAALYYQHVSDPNLPYARPGPGPAVTPPEDTPAPPADTTTTALATPTVPQTPIGPAPLSPNVDVGSTPPAVPAPLASPAPGGPRPPPANLFAAYPAAPTYQRRHGPPDLSKPQNYNFRTRIRAASREKPNFAGRWVLVNWGCGTGCSDGRLVNVATGAILPLPDAVITDPLPDPTMDVYVYKADSRLLVVNGHDGEGDTTPYNPRCYVLYDGEVPHLDQRECIAPTTPESPPALVEVMPPAQPHEHSPVMRELPESHAYRAPPREPTPAKCFTVYPAVPPPDCFSRR